MVGSYLFVMLPAFFKRPTPTPAIGVTLIQRYSALGHHPVNSFLIAEIRGGIAVVIAGETWRVGSLLSEPDAEALAKDPRYQVTAHADPAFIKFGENRDAAVQAAFDAVTGQC